MVWVYREYVDKNNRPIAIPTTAQAKTVVFLIGPRASGRIAMMKQKVAAITRTKPTMPAWLRRFGSVVCSNGSSVL